VLDVGEQQTGNAKPQRKSFEPKSDLDEQRKSVSAWGRSSRCYAPAARKIFGSGAPPSVAKVLSSCGPDRRGNPYH
jgi:hypothetical protein